MQKFKFPMEYLRVTQKENSAYSHAGSLAMDFGGKDSGADKLFCPCDMVVKRTRKNANGELYLESVNKVQFADGTEDYARLLCIHDNYFNVREGQLIKQGEYFYDEGGMGNGKANKFSTHVHIEAGKGKWKNISQFANKQGTYVIEHQVHLYDLFVLGHDVQVLDDGGYNWTKEQAKNNVTTDEIKSNSVQITSHALYIRKGPSTLHGRVGLLKYGDIVEITDKKNGYLQLASGEGWISARYTKKV